MGNTIYGKETPNLKYIDMVSIHQVPLKTFKTTASRIQHISIANQYGFIYISFHSSKKVYKYSLTQNRPVQTYKYHKAPVQFMELSLSQTRLFTMDRNVIYVIDCEKDELKRVLHTYSEDSEIHKAQFFNNRFIIVSLKNCRLFDVFDTKTSVKESMKYRCVENEPKVSCLDFGCTVDNEKLVVLDSEHLYVFRMNKLKELLRINHGGKETAILHISSDSKYLFTLRKGYITVRKLKTLEKTTTFKFRHFNDKSMIDMMQNDRLLMIHEPSIGIRFIDLLDQESVYSLKHPKIVSSYLLKDNRHLIAIDELKIDIYASDVELEFSKSVVQKMSKKTDKVEEGPTDGELESRYRNIELLVRQKDCDEALIECRDIIRVKPREHRAYFISGRLLMVKGLYDESEGFFTQAIFLSLQQEASYFVWKGKALYFLKRYQEACNMFSRALAISPNKSSAVKNLEIAKQMLAKMSKNLAGINSVTIDSSVDTNTDDDITFDYESAFEKAFGHSVSEDANEDQRGRSPMFNFRIDGSDGDLIDLTPLIYNQDFDKKPNGYYYSEEISFPNSNYDDKKFNFEQISKIGNENLTFVKKLKNCDKKSNFVKKMNEEPKKPFIDVSYAKCISTDQEATMTSVEPLDSNITGLRISIPRPLKLINSLKVSKEPPVLIDSKRVGIYIGGMEKSGNGGLIEQSEEFRLFHPTRTSDLPKLN